MTDKGTQEPILDIKSKQGVLMKNKVANVKEDGDITVKCIISM